MDLLQWFVKASEWLCHLCYYYHLLGHVGDETTVYDQGRTVESSPGQQQWINKIDSRLCSITVTVRLAKQCQNLSHGVLVLAALEGDALVVLNLY